MLQKKINSHIVIIGAGIAGLCISLYLTKNKVPHIILERGEVANTWIKERWENFHLVNPNWANKIPEFGFGPLSDDSRVIQIQKPLACRPCGLHGKKACPKGHFKCGLEIEKNQLLKLVDY